MDADHPGNGVLIARLSTEQAGDVTIEGDQAKLSELVSYLDTFEFWFNIVTP